MRIKQEKGTSRWVLLAHPKEYNPPSMSSTDPSPAVTSDSCEEVSRRDTTLHEQAQRLSSYGSDIW